MNKYCCICERLINDGDYDRIGQDYYCSRCSNNDLVPCSVCGTILNPDENTKFQGPDGHLFCSQECMDAMTITCLVCGASFFAVNDIGACPVCTGNYEDGE